MNRQRFLDLAEHGLRMPIGTDLVLREQADVEKVLHTGKLLGDVVLAAAQRYRTPLALPVMDLMLEKVTLLRMMGVTEGLETHYFSEPPTAEMLERLDAGLRKPLPPRLRAVCSAIRQVRRHGKKYVPIGMSIGPVSLMTRLMADPITPIYMAGAGMSPEAEPEVKLAEALLEIATRMVLWMVTAQLEAGATAIFIAEPAANRAYFSPRQLADGSDVWDRFVTASNQRVAELIRGHHADLMFHCCGELTDAMVHAFGELDPAILSLGSSRNLAEDAMLVPTTTVLYGNLPTKKFFSDEAISADRVAEMTTDLIWHMRHVHHPFILGSECDVLSVPGYHDTIVRKVEMMLTCCPEASSVLVA